MDIDDLSLVSISQHMHLTIGAKIVEAVAWAARLGWSDVTCRAFVTALVMTDTLGDRGHWPTVIKKISDLKIAADLASLKAGRVITREVE